MVFLPPSPSEAILAKCLCFLATRLRWPQYLQLFLAKLTPEDWRSLSLPKGKLPDPIFAWAKLSEYAPEFAAADLSCEFGLISPEQYKRLRSAMAAIEYPESAGAAPVRQQRESDQRQMVSGRLLGRHTHETNTGVNVHIWKRNGRFMARGSYQNERFGLNLGCTEAQAEADLHRLLVEIDNGSFVRPSVARRMPIRQSSIPRLSIEQLCNHFCTDVRGVRGKRTSGTYLSRLKWLILFAERPDIKRKWPLALQVDRAFVREFRKFLYNQVTTPNGHPGAEEVPAGPRFVFNVLDCCRTMFKWAHRAEVRKLPPGIAQPFTADLVGHRPKKDPLRDNPVPINDRISLVRVMDEWELCQFAIPLVLSLRPEDFGGLLVSEVDFDNHVLRFGTRFGGCDFNKNRLSYRVPFPKEISPILRRCVDGRSEGPLLRKRSIVEGTRRAKCVTSTEEIVALFREYQRKAGPDELQTDQDLKILFRRLLGHLGGITGSTYGKAFGKIAERSVIDKKLKPYDLRAAVMTEMRHLRIEEDIILYVTCHEPSRRNIINQYTGLALHAEMAKYFQAIVPLLDAIAERAKEVGCND